jgi:hypothetical protein
MKTICIIPCGKGKIWKRNPGTGPTPAKDVYTGTFARKCQEYARKFYGEAYLILSAKYGFLFPNDIVPGDYNVTFKRPSTHPIKIPELVQIAHDKQLFQFEGLVIVAGHDYSEIARQVFPGKVIVTPLAKCRNMFEMIQKMNKAIKEGQPII